jgi:hypothetical protein
VSVEASGEIAVYTLLALAIALLVFFGALRFVAAAKRGHRRFKWRAAPSEGGSREKPTPR